MLQKPFSAYEGEMPYFFVSYAHENADLVYAEMAWINDAGFRLWYDDGIHVGEVWRRTLAASLKNAVGLLFFATKRSVESEHCQREINFALDEAKPVFVIHFDDTPLADELRLSLSDRQALVRSAYDEDTYRSRLVDAMSGVIDTDLESSSSSPRVQYCTTSDRVRIAYATQGSGVTLVRCLNWLTSVSLDLEGATSFAKVLSQFARVVTYDARGIGLSQRGTFDWSMAQRLDDLNSVIQAAEVGSTFTLLGISESAPTAIEYAAQHPDRVSHLVLLGPSMPKAEPRADQDDSDDSWFRDFVYLHWGTQNPLARRMMCAAWSSVASEEEQSAFMKQMRESMERDTVSEYLQALSSRANDSTFSENTWTAARRVQARTLIVHSLRDPLVPYANTQQLASALPNAEVVPLTVPAHGPSISTEFASLAAREIRRFIGRG